MCQKYDADEPLRRTVSALRPPNEIGVETAFGHFDQVTFDQSKLRFLSERTDVVELCGKLRTTLVTTATQ